MYLHLNDEEVPALIKKLKKAKLNDLADEIQTALNERNSESTASYINAANDKYGSDDINIDDDAIVSEGDSGAYVQAWVYVENPDEEADQEDDDEEEEAV